MQKDSLEKIAWKADVAFSVNIYSNLGTQVTETEYSFNLDDIGFDKLTNDGTLQLRLEWLPHDGDPTAEIGKKIGTGAYVARFNFKTKETAIANTANRKHRAGTVKKQNKEKIVNLGYRRIK